MILRSSPWKRSAKIFVYVFFKIANLQSLQLHLCSNSMKNTCEGVQISRVAETLFYRTPPSGCLCTAWKKKNERNEIVCFYSIQSGILLCGIARFSRGNKSKLRTFQPQKWKKIKNSQRQTKFTGSYKKKECNQVKIENQLNIL